MKNFLTSMVLLAAIAVMPVGAQVKFGVKGGLNNSNMKINYENLKNKGSYGWFAGPTIKALIPIGNLGIGADAAVFYDMRRAKTEIDGVESTIKQQSIVLPINVRANFDIVKVFGIYVATGPQFGFNVGKKEVDLDSFSAIKNHFQIRKSQFSWNIGAGIIIANHFELGATYNLGIGRTGEVKDMTTDEIRDTPKQKSWTVSAAYYF